MTTKEYVKIEGADEIIKGLKTASKDVKKELKKKFKQIAPILADEAKSQASSQGLNSSGALIAGIKPSIGEMQVKVNATAKRVSKKYPKGYRYPNIYEYGGRSHSMKKQVTFDPVKLTKKTTMVASSVGKRSETAKRLNLQAGADKFHGARAFMAPALKNKKEEVVKRMEEVIEKAAQDFARGGS